MKLLVIAGGIIVIAAIVFFSISQENPDVINSDLKQPTSSISIGTIHRDAAKMTDRFQPLADHIANKLSDDSETYRGTVIIPESQVEMINLINNHEIDIYIDSPIIGMKINEDAKMSPALFAWKDNAKSYHSVFFALNSSEIMSLDDIEGTTIIFEDSESTSGYFLPLYHLMQMGYAVGTESSDDVSYQFSLDDENTAIWIIEGRGDIGVVSNLDFEDIPDNARNDLKIIGTTDELPRQIVFFRDGLDVDSELIEILLELDGTEVPKVLKPSKLNKFSKLNPETDLSQVKTVLEYLNIK